MQIEFTTTACVAGHWVIQNPLYCTKVSAHVVQLLRETQDEQLSGH